MFNFKITADKDQARTGIFTTPRGDIETPVFMPVGTVGAVKSVAPWELKELGAEIILGNTYHLMLRPGEKIINKAGGLSSWTKWNGPMLTDSGGYQVFSLGNRLAEAGDSGAPPTGVGGTSSASSGETLRSTSPFAKATGGLPCSHSSPNRSLGHSAKEGKRGFTDIKPARITDRGVTFYSHLDGSKHFVDASKSIKIQQKLGADIIMAFDQCPPGDASPQFINRAVQRTHRWLDESVSAWTNRDRQALIGIVQGATNKALREASAKYINSKNLPGNAIGGVSVGESRADVWKAVEWSVPHLDANKPRYLMGVGEPVDIIEAVKRGCDMFDCVLPTRLGRHGVVWVKGGGLASKKTKMINGNDFSYQNIDLRKGLHAAAMEPIDSDCQCPACREGFSKGYLHHLIKEGEILGIRLTTLHNLNFMFELIRDLRNQIG